MTGGAAGQGGPGTRGSDTRDSAPDSDAGRLGCGPTRMRAGAGYDSSHAPATMGRPITRPPTPGPARPFRPGQFQPVPIRPARPCPARPGLVRPRPPCVRAGGVGAASRRAASGPEFGRGRRRDPARARTPDRMLRAGPISVGEGGGREEREGGVRETEKEGGFESRRGRAGECGEGARKGAS